MPLHALAVIAALAADPASSDWATTGQDCSLFAAFDVDGDGHADLLTINGNRDLCVAYTVLGAKSAPWEAVAADIPPDALAILPAPGGAIVVATDAAWLCSKYDSHRYTSVQRFPAPDGTRFTGASFPAGAAVIADGDGVHWTLGTDGFRHADAPIASAAPALLDLTPPPFDPAAAPISAFQGDINGDGLADTLAAYTTSRPYPHRVVRIALAPNTISGDRDSDGLTDVEEASLGTDADDRDTDDDGLLDGWEVHGLPRAVPGPETPLDPRRQNVIVAIAPFDPLTAEQARAELARQAGFYARLNNRNPDGSTGITLSYRFDAAIPKEEQTKGWPELGNARLPSAHRGLMHWMQVTPWGGGQAAQGGDMGGAGLNAFAHELGHQLSLSHEGDSAPPWCPLYPSLMNYAFSYSLGGDGNAIRFSDGRFASLDLREQSLSERLPFAYEDLKYLAAGPFYFPLKDGGTDGGHPVTLIDWNQNGAFDDGPVTADINYGGSTNAGTRKNIQVSGGAPTLLRTGTSIHLALLDQQMQQVSLRTYLGGDNWSEPRTIPNSASNFDPVAVGTDASGFILLRRPQGWIISRFDETTIENPVALPTVPAIDLSAGLLGGRILLVGRHDDATLTTWWLDVAREQGKPAAYTVADAPSLDFRSVVPVSWDTSPTDGRIAFVGSDTNPTGGPLNMHVGWFAYTEAKLTKTEERWVGGDKGGVHCTMRPTLRFTDAGELYIFHTGWVGENGLTTGWRTKLIANRALSDGWLVNMMYDIWTLTRKPVAFEIAGPTAIYSYRWDPGEYGETHVNHVQAAHNGLGIDTEPMRDHDDGAKMSLWGIRHSILNMRR